MSDRYFKGENHATIYNMSRPSPPENLIKNIVDYLLEKLLPPLGDAIDIGCGSGQSTEVLSPYFNKVTGIDTSEKQITEAQRKNAFHNICYRVGSAESIDCADASIQLVTASQACHWFDLPKFYAEVERILVPGGILAMYGYLLPKPVWKDKSEELSNIVSKYYNIHLGRHISHESKQVYFENYRGDDFMKIPFAQDPVLRNESFASENPGTITDVVNFMNSGSSFQNFLRSEGPDKAASLLQDFQKELLDVMGTQTPPERTSVLIQYKYFLLMARKPLKAI